uniref:Uncharacterized protein n=1 Tax=Klebsiella pneumoniae TaxID=573 RepID=A0A8B0SP95_KLEPN|nr:hypothetical protein [Klebsiella pneumoniae]
MLNRHALAADKIEKDSILMAYSKSVFMVKKFHHRILAVIFVKIEKKAPMTIRVTSGI